MAWFLGLFFPIFYISFLYCTGDPRISSVNIMWMSPETTTWIRNPSTTRKGELVLDIVLEKAAVKQSGDAWRIVLDSCLPVLHLIDANRSIPYGIKQVQDLLGVSCAFDQAVQVCVFFSFFFYEMTNINRSAFLMVFFGS